MKDSAVLNTKIKKENTLKNSFSAKRHFFEPCKSGLFGFAAFITILILVKLFSFAIGSYDYFALEITDVELSLIGFVLLFLIRFLENFKEQKTD